jgi:Zn finger protein HypA/HybF involved in hydrogenase expression
MVSEYRGGSIKATFKCSKGHFWITSPRKVIEGSGCHHCSKEKSHLAKELIDKRLASRGIKIISTYKDSKTPSEFECSLGHRWFSNAGPVLLGRGCPHCSGNARLTKDAVNKRLADRGFRIIGDYISALEKTLFECPNGHQWEARPANILNGQGCALCANNQILSKEIVNERTFSRGIKLIGEYSSSKEKALFQCKEGHEWMAVPSNVLFGRGCPICADTAFKFDEPADLYFLRIEHELLDAPIYKIGISKNTQQRIRDLRKYRPNTRITLQGALHFSLGRDAREMEKFLHQTYADYQYFDELDLLESGYTELFILDVWARESTAN